MEKGETKDKTGTTQVTRMIPMKFLPSGVRLCRSSFIHCPPSGHAQTGSGCTVPLHLHMPSFYGKKISSQQNTTLSFSCLPMIGAKGVTRTSYRSSGGNGLEQSWRRVTCRYLSRNSIPLHHNAGWTAARRPARALKTLQLEPCRSSLHCWILPTILRRVRTRSGISMLQSVP